MGFLCGRGGGVAYCFYKYQGGGSAFGRSVRLQRLGAMPKPARLYFKNTNDNFYLLFDKNMLQCIYHGEGIRQAKRKEIYDHI